MMLWSIVECNLGMIAGSLPMVLQLIFPTAQKSKTSRAGTRQHETYSSAGDTGMDNLASILGTERKESLLLHRAKYQADIEVNIMSEAGRRGHPRCDDLDEIEDHPEDGSSTRRMIFVTRCVEQTSHTKKLSISS